MSIGKYEIFMKVAELGSLTKAAEELRFTQSGVSHTISGLEADFGFPLFVRGRGGLKLTANGERVLAPVREIMKWNEQLKQEVTAIHGLETGTVTIGTFTSVSVHWLPGILKRFRADYPYIGIRLMEGGYLEIEQWIEAGVVDCGFLSLPTRDKFETVPLARDRMLGIVAADHHLAGQPFLYFSQIAEEPFIMPKAGSDYDVRRALDRAGVKPSVAYSAGDDYAIMAMVESGLGISILPELVMRRQPYELRTLTLQEPGFREIGLAARSMKTSSPAARRFIQYVSQYVEARNGAGFG